MNYAYLDKYGILHIVSNIETANKYSSSKVINIDVKNAGGYPLVEHNGQLVSITVYTKEGKFLVEGQKERPISELAGSYPEVSHITGQLI